MRRGFVLKDSCWAAFRLLQTEEERKSGATLAPGGGGEMLVEALLLFFRRGLFCPDNCELCPWCLLDGPVVVVLERDWGAGCVLRSLSITCHGESRHRRVRSNGFSHR